MQRKRLNRLLRYRKDIANIERKIDSLYSKIVTIRRKEQNMCYACDHKLPNGKRSYKREYWNFGSGREYTTICNLCNMEIQK